MKARGILKAVLLTAACGSMGSYAHAQAKPVADTTTPKKLQMLTHPKLKPKVISREVSVGARLNTDGWSAYTDIGKIKATDTKHADMFYNVRFWEIEFTEKKNPHEQKSMSESSSSGGSPSNYIFGKINNFYAVKLGYGFRKLIAGKPDPGSVSIHWVNTGGLSIGLLKPYYLNVFSDPSAIKYSENTQNDFLTPGLIEGKAGFSKGLSEIKIIPGAHFKSALHFDFSANKKTALAVEAGINLEYYSQEVAIMARESGTNYFFDAFIAFQLGRRW